MPYAAFSGPMPSVNLTMIAYPGSYHYRAAKRTAQRYPYSHAFPDLFYNTTQGLFFGGNFCDGRATGMKLQSVDAEQAQGPPVDPLEMGNPDIACIAWKISHAPYLPLFKLVWGDSFNIQWPFNTAKICATPEGAFGSNAEPIALSADDRTKATNIFDHWGQSLSFLEQSTDINPFSAFGPGADWLRHIEPRPGPKVIISLVRRFAAFHRDPPYSRSGGGRTGAGGL
jgi:cytochrome c peroxidase